jgi:hypothetical protein
MDAQQREAMRIVGELVREGVESGPATPFTAEDWVTIRQEGKAVLEQRTQQQAHTCFNRRSRSKT